MLALVIKAEREGVWKWPVGAVALVLSQNQGVKLARCKNSNLCVECTICQTSNEVCFFFLNLAT